MIVTWLRHLLTTAFQALTKVDPQLSRLLNHAGMMSCSLLMRVWQTTGSRCSLSTTLAVLQTAMQFCTMMGHQTNCHWDQPLSLQPCNPGRFNNLPKYALCYLASTLFPLIAVLPRSLQTCCSRTSHHHLLVYPLQLCDHGHSVVACNVRGCLITITITMHVSKA